VHPRLGSGHELLAGRYRRQAGDCAAGRGGDGGVGRDAIPPYGEGHKDPSGLANPTGLGKGLEGVPLAVAKQVTPTCKVPTGV
jgi:hypothetical protein